MSRLFAILLLVSIMAVAAGAQTRTVPVPLPPIDTGGLTILPYPISGPGVTRVDQHGNLLVFDTRYSYPQTTPSPNVRIRINPIPTTRVSVVTAAGTVAATREYAGAAFQLVGGGQWGTYAILSSFSLDQNSRITIARKIVAINAGVTGLTLPQTAAEFPSAAVADSVTQVDVVRASDRSPDTLYAVSGSYLIAIPTPLGPNVSSLAPAPRTATVYTYSGGSALTSKTVNLP